MSNAKFRRLWGASVISLLGEWFNTIALFFLILEYSGSVFLLGILFSIRTFLFALSQPFNGLLADRFNRKTLMLWSNILQVGLALSFLLVDGEEDMKKLANLLNGLIELAIEIQEKHGKKLVDFKNGLVSEEYKEKIQSVKFGIELWVSDYYFPDLESHLRQN